MAHRYRRRLAQTAVTLWVATTLAFVLVRMLPGGNMGTMTGDPSGGDQVISVQYIDDASEVMGYRQSDPIHVQYVDFLQSLVFEGSLGTSVYFETEVLSILLKALPWTLYYSALSLVVGFLVQVLLGAAMAYRQGSWFDYGVTVTGFFASSVPYYVVALLTVTVLGFHLEWFPTSGHYDYDNVEPGLSLEFYGSVVYHSVLLVVAWVPGWLAGSLGMRANAIRVLGADYLRVARLRGLPTRRIASRYVARNAMLPMYTKTMVSVSSLFGGAIILEKIFAYPGIGFYMLTALETADHPLLIGGFLFSTTATLLAITIADFTYGLVDPRAGGGSRETY